MKMLAMDGSENAILPYDSIVARHRIPSISWQTRHLIEGHMAIIQINLNP